MMKKKKVLIIGTGGTIASIKTKQGLRPAYKTDEIISFFPEIKEIAGVKGVMLFNIDSTNMQPHHWSEIAMEIGKNYYKYDGFVITHGTDTMHYTASALSFMMKNLKKPVVLTGSVKAIGEESDAKQNFIDSVLAATSSLREVCIVFHGKIIKGSRARKITNEATTIADRNLGVYSSINCHLVGELIGRIEGVYDRRILFNEKYTQIHNKKKFKVAPKVSADVVLLKIYPGMKSDILEKLKDYRCIILEAFGPGNIPFLENSLIDTINFLNKKGVAIFVATQNPFGETDMNLYEVGLKATEAGAISCRDMTSESAVTKAMWLVGNYSDDVEKIKRLMIKNFAGEIRS